MMIAVFALRPRPTVYSGTRSWTVSLPPTAGAVSPPSVTAKAAFLADADTGQELYSLNPDLELPNASTTKIITATLAIQHGDLDRTVIASKKAADTEPANIAMKPGEKFTLRDLLYAMMIHSANDAAEAVAEAVGGSRSAFIDEMNEEARRLGCTHTHFVTPNGLQDPQHYTTARDLSVMTEYALRIPLFNELIKTHEHKIKRSINQKFLMMRRSHGDRFLFKYPGADGVKTGYTHPAGRCYVGAACRPDSMGSWRLLSVALHSKDTFKDTSAMMDYGFKAWTRSAVVRKGQIVGSLSTAPGSSAPVRRSPAIAAGAPVIAVLRADQLHTIELHYHVAAAPPLESGHCVGSLEVSVDGGKKQYVPLVLPRAVPRSASWRRYQEARLAFGSLAFLAVGCSYGSFAKANRRRRVLLSPRGGNLDSQWPGPAERPNGRHR